MGRRYQFATSLGQRMREVVLLVWPVSADALVPPATFRAAAEAQACLAWLAESFTDCGVVEPLPDDHALLVAAHYAFMSGEDYYSKVVRVLSRLALPQ